LQIDLDFLLAAKVSRLVLQQGESSLLDFVLLGLDVCQRSRFGKWCHWLEFTDWWTQSLGCTKWTLEERLV